MIEDVAGQIVQTGSFVAYAAKTEAPGIQFGWIDEVKFVPSRWGNDPNVGEWKVKVVHADPQGNRKNKEIFGKDPVTGEYGYQDTGKLSTVWLNIGGRNINQVARDGRMLVVTPY